MVPYFRQLHQRCVPFRMTIAICHLRGLARLEFTAVVLKVANKLHERRFRELLHVAEGVLSDQIWARLESISGGRGDCD